MTVECTVRGILPPESLRATIEELTRIHGQGEEFEEFIEIFKFTPNENLSNYNLILRDQIVRIVHTGTRRGSTITFIGPDILPGASPVVTDPGCGWTIGRFLKKSGFKPVADFGQKGFKFAAGEIKVSRPFNGRIGEGGKWEPVGGTHPIGENFLIEIYRYCENENEIENEIGNIRKQLNSIIR